MHNYSNLENFNEKIDLGKSVVLKGIFKQINGNTGYEEDDSQIIEDEDKFFKSIFE